MDCVGGSCVSACGNGVCGVNENCPADVVSCADNVCYEPTCTDGCGQTPVLNGQTDESCQSPSYCNGAGSCITSPSCPDTDGDGLGEGTGCPDLCPGQYGTYCRGCPQPSCGTCQQPACPVTGVPACQNSPSTTQCGTDTSCSYTGCSGICGRTGTYTDYHCTGFGSCQGYAAACSPLTCSAGTSCSAGSCISASETCNNIDDNCNGQIDENLQTSSGCSQVGYCSGSYKTCSAGLWGACSKTPQTEVCDGIDNDCDGQTDESLGTTTCGVGICQHTVQNCLSGSPNTCNPFEGATTEICDTLDNDCDGSIDEGCSCTNGQTRTGTCGMGACARSVSQSCSGGTWTPACVPGSPATETCNNIDDDCDGYADDGLSRQQSCGIGICFNSVSQACSVGSWLPSCTPGLPSTETCNGVDDDCNGQTDEACSEICDGIDNDGDGLTDESCDSDGDSYIDGSMQCSGNPLCAKDDGTIISGCNGCSNLDCDDTRPEVHPGAVEKKCDNLDTDCDGVDDIDEFTPDGKRLCDCSFISDSLKITTLGIRQPKDMDNKAVGETIPFLSTSNANIDFYEWDFGDSQVKRISGEESLGHAYSSSGIYTVKLKAMYMGCEKTASVKLNITGCSSDAQCSASQECREGRCVEKQAEITETPFTIQIHSPEAKTYGQKQVPLVYTATQPSKCSYSLNNADFADITPNIEAKEGLNTLKIRCNDTIASMEFTVKLETGPTTVVDELKGKGKGNLMKEVVDRSEPMTVTRQDSEQLFSEALSLKGLEVEKTGEGRMVTLSIRNLLGIHLDNIKLKVTIPKDISETADSITSPQEFTIIENDPVIQFIISSLKDNAFIILEVGSELTQELLGMITVETDEDINALVQRQQETADALKISKEFEEYEKDGERYTRIKTRILPKKTMDGLSVIESIPKCLARQVDSIQMDEKYRSQIRILNPDPLIMWHFEEITSEKYFEYEIKGTLTEECKKQIRAMGIADELGLDIDSTSYLSMFLPLLLIPLIGILIVHFHRSGPPKEEDKEEGKVQAKKAEARAPEKPVQKKNPLKMDLDEFHAHMDEKIRELDRELKKRIK